tara:strand:- start:32 stop:649 length:618 start_codon:yes stop_codon:yes gene_type:complete
MGAKIDPLAGGLILPPKQDAPPLTEVYTNPVTKEILDGFGQSDFAKNVNQMQQDSRTIEINGLPITGNGSFIGNLVSYMKSVGKEDMISDNSLKQFEPLAQVSGPNDSLNLFAGRPVLTGDEERVQAPPLLDGTKALPVTVTGPETVASVNPFEKQFSSLNERLDRLEDGIASLLGNRGQGMYMASQPNREGVGSLFPFYGGFYG